MPPRVVDVLEVIDVGHHAGEVPAGGAELGPLRLHLREEAAAIEALRQGIAGGEAVELAVLLLDLLPRGRHRLQHHRKLAVLLFDRGHVVEGRQRPPRTAAVVEDRGRVDCQRPRPLGGRLQGEHVAPLHAAVADRPQPRVVVRTLLRAGGGPVDFRGVAALQLVEGPADRLHESLVGQDDLLVLVQHQHAFGQGIQGGLHVFGDHRRRIEVPQHPPQIDQEAQQTAEAEEAQQAEKRI